MKIWMKMIYEQVVHQHEIFAIIIIRIKIWMKIIYKQVVHQHPAPSRQPYAQAAPPVTEK